MPGIVAFKRRWSVGSDDMIVPAIFLVLLHVAWIIALCVIAGTVSFDENESEGCDPRLRYHVLGYVIILACCLLVEVIAMGVSTRGTILNTDPRASMQYLLYTRLVLLILELAWLIMGLVWLSQHFKSCSHTVAKSVALGIIICDWLIILVIILSLWCTYDSAGRSWVKYQTSDEEHSKATVAYEESWDKRCRLLFCCIKEDHHKSSFMEVANLLAEFFQDLDVVPTDIVAGLVLVRQHQKMRRRVTIAQGTNEVDQFLSGMPVCPSTSFLRLDDPAVSSEYKKVVHYMRYALAAYGWPMYMFMNTGTGCCKIMPELKCCQCCCHDDQDIAVEDNCCQCNYAAMRKISGLSKLDIVYVTYHVDIGETPFYVAVDHEHKTVVLSIRGTLSLQDAMTDMKARPEPMPVDPPKEDWLAHKGMVQAAEYIRDKLKDEMLLSKAFDRDVDQGTQEYQLIIVGHSLGAGTAAILSILLHQEYPSLHCYAFSPPGGLLSTACMEETKSFITSVILGKDVVPRLGLSQLEAMKMDMINLIKKSTKSKWRIISGSMACCGKGGKDDPTGSQAEVEEFRRPAADQEEEMLPLFPPGKIIHVVHQHPESSEKCCGSTTSIYRAILADNKEFDEVLVSPTMLNDHMPDNVLEALEKVLTSESPEVYAEASEEKGDSQVLTREDTSPEVFVEASVDKGDLQVLTKGDSSHEVYVEAPQDKDDGVISQRL